MKISYAVTVYNELEEFQKLIRVLLENKRSEDEIVVLMDDKGPEEVLKYIEGIGNQIERYERSTFTNHFADWKNKLSTLCTGDFIFQLDADEYPSDNLIKSLPAILEVNSQHDVLLVPRVNTVEGLTRSHIDKWKWNVNEKGWINHPDYQWRIWKNKPEIVWVNKVHEVLFGFSNYGHLPDQFPIYHPKKIERQEKQNEYYSTL